MSAPSRSLSPPAAFDPGAVTGRVVVPLRIGFSWSFVGWVVYAACQWLMLSVLAKLGSPLLVGQFAFGMAICAPVFMLTNLQLRGVQSTDALNEYGFADYVSLRALSSAVAVIVIAVACPFLKLGWLATMVVLLVAVFKCLESFGDVIAGLMQKFEMLDSAAIALLLRGIASLAAFGAGFAMFRNLPLALVFWIVSAGIVIGSYDFRVARRLASAEGGMTCGLRWQTLRTLAITSLPLGLVSAISSLSVNLPRYTIERVLSVSELGIFASLAYPVTAATIIANSLGQSALARLSRLFAEGHTEAFKKLLFKLIGCGVVLGTGLVVAVAGWGSRILTILYTPEYGKQGSLFVMLALTAGLNAIASFLVYALTAARQFTIQLPISLVCMVTTLVCSVFLVPRYRLPGAAMALICSALVLIATASITLGRAIAKRSEGRR